MSKESKNQEPLILVVQGGTKLIAEEFVKTDKNTYNLIIIDIFKDTEMPEFLFEMNFIVSIKQ